MIIIVNAIIITNMIMIIMNVNIVNKIIILIKNLDTYEIFTARRAHYPSQ